MKRCTNVGSVLRKYSDQSQERGESLPQCHMFNVIARIIKKLGHLVQTRLRLGDDDEEDDDDEINPLVTNGISHPYRLDESTFV